MSWIGHSLSICKAPVALNQGFRVHLHARGPHQPRDDHAQKRDSVRRFYAYLASEGHVSRNEFEFFERIKKETSLPSILTQTEAAATLINSVAPNPELLQAKFKLYGRMEFTRGMKPIF